MYNYLSKPTIKREQRADLLHYSKNGNPIRDKPRDEARDARDATYKI